LASYNIFWMTYPGQTHFQIVQGKILYNYRNKSEEYV
jgi:hypothetical protein